jgi:HSP20 family protein
MAENIGRAPVKNDTSRGMLSPFRGMEQMRRQIDRMFDDFGNGLWSVPAKSFYETEAAWRRDPGWEKMPAVDVVEKEKSYEISAELPGMSDKDIEVTVANGILLIKGEKKEEKEEKKKDYYLSERYYGSFSRRFQIPEDADASKIEAKFEKGVLAVTLPKTAAAQKPEQKISIKAG